MADQSMINSIKILRDRTGAGMMDCKKALEENKGDIEKSIEWLRTKGIAKASAKSTRVAAEGLTTIKVCDCKCGNKAVIVEVNSETDFVSRSDSFKTLVDEIGALIIKKAPKTLDEAIAVTNTLITDATVKIGEKLSLRRFEIVEKTDDDSFGIYLHMGGKIGVLLVAKNANAEDLKGVAMHIAANAPLYVRITDIPKDVRETEARVQKELALKDEKITSKPKDLQEKIIASKIDSVLGETVLYEQGYILTDGKEKVGKVLNNKKMEVVSFIRYKVGEGIEKREENFAEEVMKQTV